MILFNNTKSASAAGSAKTSNYGDKVRGWTDATYGTSIFNKNTNGDTRVTTSNAAYIGGGGGSSSYNNTSCAKYTSYNSIHLEKNCLNTPSKLSNNKKNNTTATPSHNYTASLELENNTNPNGNMNTIKNQHVEERHNGGTLQWSALQLKNIGKMDSDNNINNNNDHHNNSNMNGGTHDNNSSVLGGTTPAAPPHSECVVHKLNEVINDRVNKLLERGNLID